MDLLSVTWRAGTHLLGKRSWPAGVYLLARRSWQAVCTCLPRAAGKQVTSARQEILANSCESARRDVTIWLFVLMFLTVKLWHQSEFSLRSFLRSLFVFTFIIYDVILFVSHSFLFSFCVYSCDFVLCFLHLLSLFSSSRYSVFIILSSRQKSEY